MIWQIVSGPIYLTVAVNSLHCVLGGGRKGCKWKGEQGENTELCLVLFWFKYVIITCKNTILHTHKNRKAIFFFLTQAE